MHRLHAYRTLLHCCMPVFIGTLPVRGVRYRLYFVVFVSSRGWIDFRWKNSCSRRKHTWKGTCAQLKTPFVITFLAVGKQLNSTWAQLNSTAFNHCQGFTYCFCLLFYVLKTSLCLLCFCRLVNCKQVGTFTASLHYWFSHTTPTEAD